VRFHLREAVLEGLQIEAAIRFFARGVAAMDVARDFHDGGIASRHGVQAPRDRDARHAAGGDHVAHRRRIDAEADALGPHVRDKFVEGQPRGLRRQAGYVEIHLLEIVFGLAADDLDVLVQLAARRMKRFDAIGKAQQRAFGQRGRQVGTGVIDHLGKDGVMQAHEAGAAKEDLADGGQARHGRGGNVEVDAIITLDERCGQFAPGA